MLRPALLCLEPLTACRQQRRAGRCHRRRVSRQHGPGSLDAGPALFTNPFLPILENCWTCFGHHNRALSVLLRTGGGTEQADAAPDGESAASTALAAWMRGLHLSPAHSRLVVKPVLGMAASGVTPVRGVAGAIAAARALCRQVLGPRFPSLSVVAGWHAPGLHPCAALLAALCREVPSIDSWLFRGWVCSEYQNSQQMLEPVAGMSVPIFSGVSVCSACYVHVKSADGMPQA